MSSNALTQTANSSDVWTAAANELGPSRGLEIRFDNSGQFVMGRDKQPVKAGKRFGVEGRNEGWLKLQKGITPPWVLRKPGEGKPTEPFCDPADFVKDLNGKSVSPWKWNYWIYMVDLETGTTVTYRTDTWGGTQAVTELTAQISSMNARRPGAMPIVELASTPMRTSYGTRPRPFFRVVGWRFPDEATRAPALPLVESNAFDDSVEF